jgi:hypothetical protein
MPVPSPFETFAEECERLAKKQHSDRDRKALLRMATAWLLLAEQQFDLSLRDQDLEER